VIVYKSAVMTI